MKKRIVSVITGLALMVAVTGITGLIADVYGLPITATAHACESAGSSGGC